MRDERRRWAGTLCKEQVYQRDSGGEGYTQPTLLCACEPGGFISPFCPLFVYVAAINTHAHGGAAVPTQVERIAKVAYDVAMKRGKRLCSVDKANVLDVSQVSTLYFSDSHHI